MLKFKCPYTGFSVAVTHESELPEGQILQRVEDAPAIPAGSPVYAPLTWSDVLKAAKGTLY